MRWLIPLVLCLISLGATMAPAHAEPRLALVIANGAYSGGMDPLANPVNDGKLVADTLKQLGFTVTVAENVDQKGMKRAVSAFGDALGAAGPTATALFYYAGHGLQVEGQNYLIPIGAAISKEADVDLEAVSADTVLKQMEYAAPNTSIVILDACRNNPLSRGMRSSTRGLARMDAPNGSYVAYSTAPGQTAADGTGRNSPFATALVAEMVKPGQGIEEAFRNVRINVAQVTNGEQTPWDSSSLMSSFYFAGEKQVAAIAPAPTPAPEPAAPATTSSAEKDLWDSIKDSNRAGDYAAYLEQYPSGIFAKVAQSRQAELEAQIASRNVAPAAVPATQTASIQPEAPAFESPLADGTIVLSPKTKGALDQYLTYAGGMQVFAYFAVSKDGLQHGAAGCVSKNGGNAALPICGGGGKVKEKAMSLCAAQGPAECVLLFTGTTEKASFRPWQESDGQNAVPAPAPAAVAAPEETTESPLADGTIVLSPAVAAELKAYLGTVTNQGPKTWAYFYAALNGKAAGSARCKGSGAGNASGDWPTCPAIEDLQKKMRIKAAAQKQCEAKNQGECALIYYGDQKKAEYKLLN